MVTSGITNEQLTQLAGLILAGATLLSVVLVFVGNRMTASPLAIKALRDTIEVLRGELEAERESRKKQAAEYEELMKAEAQKQAAMYTELLKDEADKRKELQVKFENQQIRYQTYIRMLIRIIKDAGITEIPEWDSSDT
jgi:hypothetical protein